MSQERGDIPPGAADWKAPGSEQPEVEEAENPYWEDPKEQELFQDGIPKEERIYLEPGVKHPVRDQKTGVTENVQFWGDSDVFKKGEGRDGGERKFKIDDIHGMVFFVDSKGNPFLTAATQEHISALEKAGYERSGLTSTIPYARENEDMGEHRLGSEPEKLAAIKETAKREAERLKEEALERIHRKGGGKF